MGVTGSGCDLFSWHNGLVGGSPYQTISKMYGMGEMRNLSFSLRNGFLMPTADCGTCMIESGISHWNRCKSRCVNFIVIFIWLFECCRCIYQVKSWCNSVSWNLDFFSYNGPHHGYVLHKIKHHKVLLILTCFGVIHVPQKLYANTLAKRHEFPTHPPTHPRAPTSLHHPDTHTHTYSHRKCVERRTLHVRCPPIRWGLVCQENHWDSMICESVAFASWMCICSLVVELVADSATWTTPRRWWVHGPSRCHGGGLLWIIMSLLRKCTFTKQRLPMFLICRCPLINTLQNATYSFLKQKCRVRINAYIYTCIHTYLYMYIHLYMTYIYMHSYSYAYIYRK